MKNSMMKHTTKIISAAAIGALMSASAFAANGVKYVDITAADGIFINDGKVVVKQQNGQYTQVVSGPTVTFHKKMKGECKNNLFDNNNIIKIADVVYGEVYATETILESYSDQYSAPANPGFTATLPWKNVQLDVPLNKLGFDPVQVCNSRLQAKMNQGMTKLQVMSVEQKYNQWNQFSAVLACGNNANQNNIKYATKSIGGEVEVICQAGSAGNPNQIAKPKIPIVAVPAGGSGGFQAGYNPLQITDANILAQSLHFVGQCPRNVVFSVQMKGNGKGKVRYHIREGNQTKYISAPVNYDSAQGWKQHNFNFEIVGEQQDINKKVNREFTVWFEEQDEGSNEWDWSAGGAMGNLQWAQTCTAQAAVPMNQGGINYNGGNQPPAVNGTIQAQPVDPTPPPSMNIKAAPATPEDKPARATN